MLIFDAHLDLGLNAVDWNRDLRMTVDEIRSADNLGDSDFDSSREPGELSR